MNYAYPTWIELAAETDALLGLMRALEVERTSENTQAAANQCAKLVQLFTTRAVISYRAASDAFARGDITSGHDWQDSAGISERQASIYMKQLEKLVASLASTEDM